MNIYYREGIENKELPGVHLEQIFQPSNEQWDLLPHISQQDFHWHLKKMLAYGEDGTLAKWTLSVQVARLDIGSQRGLCIMVCIIRFLSEVVKRIM